MKRLIALLALVVLSLSLTNSYADNKEELTFQGIPWFSSPKDAYQILLDKGFIDKPLSDRAI